MQLPIKVNKKIQWSMYRKIRLKISKELKNIQISAEIALFTKKFKTEIGYYYFCQQKSVSLPKNKKQSRTKLES